MAAPKPKLVSATPKVLKNLDELKALIDSGAPDQRLHTFFDPRLSKELIINQPAEYQRRPDRGYVALYRRAMAAKPSRWRHNQVDNVMVFDTQYQMMSGQHRCLAAVEANAIFGAWVIGRQQGSEVKYLDQVRARTVGQTIELLGHPNAAHLAGVAKMFLFWTIDESPLAPGRISPDEAQEILAAYPEINEWYLEAKRIKKNEPVSTPSVGWLTYLIGRMVIEDQDHGERFAQELEEGSSEGMAGVLLQHWRKRKGRNSLADKIWYHNTAARAWEASLSGVARPKLISPKDRLLDWAARKV